VRAIRFAAKIYIEDLVQVPAKRPALEVAADKVIEWPLF
jgi:hypothetical protein